jgi:hypothetical protein
MTEQDIYNGILALIWFIVLGAILNGMGLI